MSTKLKALVNNTNAGRKEPFNNG